MAINNKAYSPKEFQFLIAEQDDFGTLEPAGGNNYVAIDVDSIGSPTMNVNHTLDVRTGSRVLQATDFFQDNLNKVMEFSVVEFMTWIIFLEEKRKREQHQSNVAQMKSKSRR